MFKSQEVKHYPPPPSSLLVQQIRIRVGEYDFSSVREPHPYVERAVKRKEVHPKYNFFTYENDLALVQLEQPLQFLPHISPICLPGNNDLLIGERGTVTGWGRLSEHGRLPSVLQKVRLLISFLTPEYKFIYFHERSKCELDPIVTHFFYLRSTASHIILPVKPFLYTRLSFHTSPTSQLLVQPISPVYSFA